MFRRSVLLCCLGLSLAQAGTAWPETPGAFPEFQAKRVTAPGAKTAAVPDPARRRITVQIDPKEQAERLAALPKFPAATPKIDSDAAEGPRPPAQAGGSYDWFWDAVSPAMADSGPGRLDTALRAIAGSGRVRAPRLQDLQDIARAQGASILGSTVGTSVSPALVLAVISVESAGRSNAVSHAGAAGLMQLMPDTATRFGVSDRLVAQQSIAGGVKSLDWLMREFDNDPILVLAGYNAGEGAVKKHGGVPPYAETRDYVPKVLAAFQIASGLCRTRPELITDGCVFVAMN